MDGVLKEKWKKKTFLKILNSNYNVSYNFEQYPTVTTMIPKILSQDSNYDEFCEQEILNAYKEAAECDEYLFGDYDYEKEWLNSEGH